jgi:hypothetical protein
LEHERIHQALSLMTSHGQFTVILNEVVKHGADQLAAHVHFNFDQMISRLLECSFVCHEGYATWHQLSYIRVELNPSAARDASKDLPDEYRAAVEVIDRIATFFSGLRSGWQLLSLLIGTFSFLAMSTDIQEQFANRPPEYGELRSFLEKPGANPDVRLRDMVARLGTSLHAHELHTAVAHVFHELTEVTAAQDGSRWWHEKPGFDTALLQEVARWALSEGIAIDNAILIRSTARAHKLRHEYLESFGLLREVPPMHKSEGAFPKSFSSIGAHHFDFDTLEGEAPVLSINSIEQAASWIAAARRDVSAHSLRFGWWTVGLGERWMFEVAAVTAVRDTSRNLTIGAVAAMNGHGMPTTTVLETAALLGSQGALVLPSMTLDTAAPAALKRLQAIVPEWCVYVERASVANTLAALENMSPRRGLCFYETPLKPYVAVFEGLNSSEPKLFLLLDPSVRREFFSAFSSRLEVREEAVSLAEADDLICTASLVVTHSTLPSIIESVRW